MTKDTGPELSIIIVSYNTKKILHRCITSIYTSWKLIKQPKKIPFEIIVIDNNSSDGSQKILEALAKKHKNIRLFFNKQNVGFGSANNQGIEYAKSPYILLLNSDTFIIKDALYRLLSYYKQKEQTVHFLGPRLLNKDLSIQASAAPFYTLPVVFAALFLRGDYWGLTRFSPRKTQRVDWISGACILTKKQHLTTLGNFDSSVFMYMEEVDLLYRARKAGMATFIFPKAKILHIGSASSQMRTYPILQVYKGLIFFYKKHYSVLSLFLLRGILMLKAAVSWFIGYIFNNSYLKKTYAQAFKVAGQ